MPVLTQRLKGQSLTISTFFNKPNALFFFFFFSPLDPSRDYQVAKNSKTSMKLCLSNVSSQILAE
jgi:hypothetical protein